MTDISMTDILSAMRNMLKRPSPQSQFASVDEVERAIGFQRIREQIWPQIDALDELGMYHYLLDVYFDGGFIYAIISANGKLFRADVRIVDDTATLGEKIPVTELFVPVMGTERQITRVFETNDGRWRWLSISATAFLNRVGEIDSMALFDSFIAHANETGEFPYRTFLHSGEKLRTGQADFLARDGVCYITSGLYDEDNPLAMVEVMAFQNEPERWGESIGYYPSAPPAMLRVADGINVPVYTAGVHAEISTCLESRAASWFTVPFTTEVNRMNADLKEQLQQLMDDAKLDEGTAGSLMAQFETSVDGVNERASEPGAIARAQTDTGDTPADEESVEEAATGELVIDESVVRAVVDELQARGALQQDNAAVVDEIAALRERLEEAEATINSNFAALNERVSTVEDTLDDEEDLLDDLPPQTQRHVVYRPSNPHPHTEDEEESSTAAVQNGLAKVPAYKS